MVMLFMSLGREAGIPVQDVPRERRMKESPATRPRTTTMREPVTRRIDTQATRFSRDDALLFGISEEDIGSLDDDEFNEVWSALGTVARARARARKQSQEQDAEKGPESEEGKEESTGK